MFKKFLVLSLILLVSLIVLGQKSDQVKIHPDPVPVYPGNYKVEYEGRGILTVSRLNAGLEARAHEISWLLLHFSLQH